jgi:hypothetical protein
MSIWRFDFNVAGVKLGKIVLAISDEPGLNKLGAVNMSLFRQN